ncbi:T9SS type A sorting domain-containing protein [Panacibacter sp. DH6]|uniref:T9SS type A sorting domain-containing protein n=1 Tax=Panacibacter microcysteis TaxID=2793269 RepID=A0A931E412_9BACT|nr:T9SS type A sorting domain-containing protein [Panacibacter microcysteis]MBG9377235.1 T9SS type A sorting domain-containing protein [Panacibacter microcysteis]
MKTINVFLLLLCLCNVRQVYAQAIIYKHDFGNVNITTHPYTVAPSILNPNLNTSSWSNSIGTWTSGTGATGRSIVMSNSTGTPTVTLTFNVALGYAVSITSFNFWRERGNSGATQWTMSVNGTSAGTGTIPQAPGSYIGNKAIVGDPFLNLTGTVTVTLSLSGAAGVSSPAFSLDDFTLYGIVTNITAGTQNRIFRTVASGSWKDLTTWESAPTSNPTNFSPATTIPSSGAASITIRSGHIVTTDIVASAKVLTVENGATLNQNSPLFIIQNNVTLPSFVVSGTLILNGAVPDVRGTNAALNRMEVNGVVRVDAVGSEGLANNNPRVTFNSGSVFQWNTPEIPETAQTGLMTYFPNATGLKFRISANLDGLGVTGPGITQFNAKMEVDNGITVKLIRNGDKIFRDGLGGAGTIIHQSLNGGAISNCGPIKVGVSGSPAVIDGTVNIIVQQTTNNDIDMAGNVTISGSPTITVGQTFFGFPDNANFTISGNLLNNGSIPVDLTNGSLTFSGNGKLITASTNTFKPGGTVTGIKVLSTLSNAAVGVLKFASGFNTVNSITMGDKSAPTSTSARLVFGHDVNVENNINLYQGIIVTDDKLLTWNNSGGIIDMPATYTNSFIATCNQTGQALGIAGVNATTTTAFTGNSGFRIKNVKGFFYSRFPVAADFSRPNKIEINPGNNTPTDITVVVGKGDILSTPQPRVNRIWYVHASNQANVAQSGIRLYFTKHDWNSLAFGIQDEVEDGFIPTQVYVGRKDYLATNFLNNRSVTPRNIGALDGLEGYAEYILNTGIGSSVPAYYKFSAGNFATIILPVTITNFHAYQKNNNVVLGWTAVNETNVDYYEVEHSADGINFLPLQQVNALNNGKNQNDYTCAHQQPQSGRHYYRLKFVDNDGTAKYSGIATVDIEPGGKAIRVYPNPVENRQLNIQLNDIAAGTYSVVFYDMNGNLIYTAFIAHAGGSGNYSVHVPARFITGTYTLSIRTREQQFRQVILIR